MGVEEWCKCACVCVDMYIYACAIFMCGTCVGVL